MAKLPARPGGRSMTLIDPSREFEDIYDRMGQLVNVALGEGFSQVRASLERQGVITSSLAFDIGRSNDAFAQDVGLKLQQEVISGSAPVHAQFFQLFATIGFHGFDQARSTRVGQIDLRHVARDDCLRIETQPR